MIQDYTVEQIEKVKYRLEILDNMNSSITSHYKFKDLKMYKDEIGNIFLYYLSHDEVQQTYDYFYIEYDRLGNETVLNKSFSLDDLKIMFLNFKQFEF